MAKVEGEKVLFDDPAQAGGLQVGLHVGVSISLIKWNVGRSSGVVACSIFL